MPIITGGMVEIPDRILLWDPKDLTDKAFTFSNVFGPRSSNREVTLFLLPLPLLYHLPSMTVDANPYLSIFSGISGVPGNPP